jgi:para-nitrobenzyl esterase
MALIVTTTSGQLQGRERNGVLSFAGIPFAAPPTGERRFRPPAPHPGWDGVRDATRFGKVAPQIGGGLGAALAGRTPDWDEDCLFLNVQTEALDDGRRPVMVWIHGGGFAGGTGAVPWYDGKHFVEHGNVVVVSINYRLGALGWMHLGGLDPDYRAGNVGLLDQIAALEWVRDNIAAFGGNPDDVTIFGESAGAMSVGTLMGTPRAQGLFHAAIAQSGAAHNVTSADDAAVVAEKMLETLGVDDVDGLLALDAAAVLEAQSTVSAAAAAGELGHGERNASGLIFGPVLDGEVLPEPPVDAVRAGSSASVPLLIGTNLDEWNLFALARNPVTDDATIVRRLATMVDGADEVVAAYRAGRPDASSNDVWSAIVTDRVFRIPAIRLAEAQLAHQPEHTFMYLFEWPSTAFDGRLGACHALEIPFVFDNLDKGGIDQVTGPEPPQSIADAMHAAWLAFVHDRDPSGGGEQWPAYDTGRRATMIFDRKDRVDDDPLGAERAVWDARL